VHAAPNRWAYIKELLMLFCHACPALPRLQRDLSPATILDATGNMLMAHVQEQQPAAADCMQDVLSEAAQAAHPLLASA
jgi:hypothetical protein